MPDYSSAPNCSRDATFIDIYQKSTKKYQRSTEHENDMKKIRRKFVAPSVGSTRGMTSGVSVLGTMDRTFALIVPKNTTISSPKNRQKNIFILYIFLSFISKTNAPEMSGKN